MIEDCAGRRYLTDVALLWAVSLMVLAIVGTIAWQYENLTGILWAVATALVCTVGTTVALAIGRTLRKPELALYRLFAEMTARMAFPLILAVGYAFSVSEPGKTGMLYYLAVFYLTTLTTETILTLPGNRPENSHV